MTREARRPRRIPLGMAILSMTGLFAVLIPAAEAQPLQPGQWSARLGAGAFIGPSYPGSDSTKVLPFPLVDVAYRPALLMLDTVFLNFPDGLGVIALRRGPFSVGGSIGYAFGRDESESSRLRGLGDIDGAARASIFVRADLGRFGLSLQANRIMGDQEGTTIVVGGTVRQPIGARLMLMGKIEATWADEDHMQQWFGVTDQQASRSQFITYSAESGFRSAGASLSGIYRITDNWSLNATLGITQLLGDAADSPITEQKTQPFGMLGAAYRF